MIMIILAVCALALCLYYSIHDLYLIYICKFPPGPLSLPLIGGLHYLDPKRPHHSIRDLGAKYGGIFSLRMGPLGRVIFINDYKIIKQVCENKSSADRPHLPFIDIISSGASGIGSVEYGKKWKILTKCFHTALVKIASERGQNLVDKQLDFIMQRINAEGERPFDPREVISISVLNCISGVAYGEMYNSADDENLRKQYQNHWTIMRGLQSSNLINLFPFLWKLPTAFNTKVREVLQMRDSFMSEKYIEHKKKPFMDNTEDLMDVILEVESSKKIINSKITIPDLFNSLWCLFLAGTDTFTDAILWIFLYLMKNPKLQAEVQREVDEAIREGNTFYPPREKLPYTEAFVLEVLRIVTPVHMGIPHYTSEDIEVGPYKIPKETQFFPTLWTVHHSEKNWPCPERFDPTRFLNTDGELISKEKLSDMPFVPFGIGRRVCLGKTLVMELLVLIVSSFLKNYTIELPEGENPDMEGITTLGLKTCPYKMVSRRRHLLL
ncbi:hypothetical protein CHS0354_043055 [Potamilus streckersoni]|uniref:Cytochrome P450 n=1 Tax=Potamilus streckersoni TaxID=2493646 RepID=A0AAE0SDA8_9BIVA|nr:hypothetical protein CHS0354_043055 [Potamilus streckersoni]